MICMRAKAEVEEALEVWRDFERPSMWQRSRKGNLWREWDGVTLTIYRRGRFFKYCVADGDNKRYSARAYKTEKEAMTELGELLGLSD